MHMTSLKVALIILLTESIELNINEGSSDMELSKKTLHKSNIQFKTNILRILLITIPVLVVVVGGILWAAGVFRVSRFSYFPDREYVLAPVEKHEPKTLKELLHSDLPSVDTLLKNPEIAQELLQAENLTDIVDSRLALNNLRSLDEQLNERLKEETPVVVDISAGVAGNGTSFGTMAQAVSTAGPGYAVDAGGFLSFMQASGRNTANLLGQPSFANIFSGITAERQAAATDWQQQ